MEGPTLSSSLADIVSVLTSVATFITGNTIMYTMFAGGLMVIGARVFKKIKNAVSR